MYCFKAYLYTILVFVFISCGKKSPSEHSDTNFVTVTDGVGRKVQIPTTINRVVALSPSMTEILFQLVPQKVVGRTDQCDFPEACLQLPSITVYPTVDYEKLLKWEVDVVFSMDNITPPEVAEKLAELGVPVLLYSGDNITAINSVFQQVAAIVGESEKGKYIVDSLKTALQVLSTCEKSKSVISLVSIDPIYVYGKGSVLDDKLDVACFTNEVDADLGKYPMITKTYFLKKDPEVIIGGDFNALDSTFFELYPELRNLKAYKNKQIFAVEDNLSARPTMRYVELIKQLKAIHD